MQFFVPIPTGGGDSTDPGIENVLAPGSGGPSTYRINGVDFIGTLTLDFPSPSQIAAAVWGASLTDYSDSSKFGGFVRKLLTVAKFLGLQ